MWARYVMFFCGARLRIEGGDWIRDGVPRFYVGNHQSALDITALLAALEGHVRFLAKESLFRIPIFGWILKRSDFIPVDRSNARKAKAKIESMLERFRARPISLVIFPEGTRSRDGELLPFRRGAMKICNRAALPVVPFAIDGSCAVAPAKRFAIYPGSIVLRFGDPVSAEEVAGLTPEQLHDRVRGAVEGLLDTIRRERRGARTGDEPRGAAEQVGR